MLTFASAQTANAETSAEAKPEAARQSPTASPENSLLQRQATLSGVVVRGVGGGFAPPNTHGGRGRDREPFGSGFDAETSPKTSAGSGFAFARLPVTPPLIQYKLTVSSAEDPFELEADAVAEKVMRKADPSPVGAAPPAVQRKCTECSETPSPCPTCDEEAKALQREATGAASSHEAPPSVSKVLAQPGAPLPADVRAYMEPRFAADFGGVRIHTGGEAARSADAVRARAYTAGQHIVFASGAFAPESEGGRRLIAHELTHVLQQRSGLQRLQRAPTRGAGGCASLNEPDEDDNGPVGAGRAAHTQIQSYLRRLLNEVPIPRATKRSMGSAGCQEAGVEQGYADLYLRGGSEHQIAEIKPTRHDMSHAVAEADHYIRRAGQSMDRFFRTGKVCPRAAAGEDDAAFADRVRVHRLHPTFARMTGILPTDTVIGAFDGDRSRTLKARLHSPGAVGYWCTGGKSDTYTCGTSDQETQEFIDRVALGPAMSLLDTFLRENIERRLERVLSSYSIGDIIAVAERYFGPSIRRGLRPFLPPGAEQIFNRATAPALGRVVEQHIGPEARVIVTTLIRRMTSIIVGELRRLLRGMLAGMVRAALRTLCVGVPAVTLVELLERLRRLIRDKVGELMPQVVGVVTAQVAAFLALEFAKLYQGLMEEIGKKFLAFIGMIFVCIGVIILAVLTVVAIIDLVPGDEVVLGALTAALARLVPTLGRYIWVGSFA